MKGEAIALFHAMYIVSTMSKSDKSLIEKIQTILSIITLTMTIIGLVKRVMDWSNRYES